jgi:tetratricopeptide (TPR) repeat protein
MFRHPLATDCTPISRLIPTTSVVLAALLAVSNLCAQDVATDQKVTANRPVLPAETAPLPQKEIYRRLLKSTAYIVVHNKENQVESFGSGWLLDKERKLLVTNHHVVDMVKPMRVFFPEYNNGRPVNDKATYLKQGGIKAEILIADVEKDLAVLKLAEVPAGVEPVVLADESPSPGDTVYSIGNPGTSAALWILSTGTVRSVHPIKIADFNGTIIESQSPVNPGDSGGPAVNDRGHLVGVVFSYRNDARLSSNLVDLSEVKKFAARADRLNEPKTADLFVERGMNAKANKRLDAAIADFTSALKMQPKHAVAFTRRGDCFREQRDYKTALSDYNDAIAADPKLSSAYTGRALVYRAQRKFDDALTDTTTAIRLNPDYYHPSYLRGLVHLDKQDTSSALTDFEKAITLAEKIPAAKHQTLSSRARTHELNRDYKAAFTDYVAAMDLKPSDLTVYRRLGDMLLDKADDPRTALQVSNAVLRNQPNYFHALIHRGRALVALNNVEDGLRDLSAAIRAADDKLELSQAYLQRGLVYDNRGELKNAGSDYLAAIEANGDDSRAFYRLGDLMLLKANDAATAIRLFTETLKHQPKSPFAYRERGRAYRAANQDDKAILDLDEAIRLNPKFGYSYNYRGDYYAARRDFDAAIRDYKTAVSIDKSEFQFHYDLANALAGKGDLRSAVKSLDAAIKINPKHAQAHVNRAIARYRLGDQAGSRSDMQTARELDPKLKDQEVKQRYSNYLNVKNGTSEPLVVYFQYYTPTADGSFRWYPAEPGPDSQPLRVHLEPGEGTGLIDPKYKGMNIKGAKFRIWARGQNSNRDYIQHRDTDLVAVPKEGYVGSDYGITTYTFR